MALGKRGGHADPYVRNPSVDAKKTAAAYSTPEGGSKPHGHTRETPKGQGNTRPGPH